MNRAAGALAAALVAALCGPAAGQDDGADPPSREQVAATVPDADAALIEAARTATTDQAFGAAALPLARLLIDQGDFAAALLMAEDMRGRGLVGAEALAAEALARLGRPVDALARASGTMSPGLGAALKDLAKGDPAAAGWAAAAPARRSTMQAADAALDAGAARVLDRLDRRDIEGAAAEANAALAEGSGHDPVAVRLLVVVLDALDRAGRPDLAPPFAERLVAVPPAYLAVLPQSPVPHIRQAVTTLVSAGDAARAVALGEALAGIAATVEPSASVERPHALVELGSAYRETGRLADAARVLDEAIALLGPAPDGAFRSGLAVQARIDRAYVAQDEGRFEEAEAVLDAARVTLEATAAGDRAAGWVAMLGARAEVRVAAGDSEGAVAAAREAVERASVRGGAEPGDLALAQLWLARMLLMSGDATGARAVAAGIDGAALAPSDRSRLAALGTEPQGRDAVGGSPSALARAEAAALARAEGDEAGARASMEAALAEADPDDPTTPYLAAGLGGLLIGLDDDRALDLLRTATWALTQPDRRHEPFARDHLPQHVALALAAADRAEGMEVANAFTEAFQVAQRVNDLAAGAALGRASARLLGGSPEATRLARDSEEASRAVAAAQATFLSALAGGSDAEPARAALVTARARAGDATAAIADAFPDYAALADPRPPDLVSVMRLLGPDEVLVLYATTDLTDEGGPLSRAFALTAEGFLAVPMPARADLLALARRLRCEAALTDSGCGGGGGGETRGAFTLDAPEEGAFDLALAHEAWATLLAPLADALDGKTSLIVVPDRALVALPFHLLVTAPPAPGDGLREAAWLIRDRSVTIAPSVGSLVALRRAAAPAAAADRPFLGIGDPLIGGSTGGAPCTGAAPPTRAAGLPVADVRALPALPETRCEILDSAARLGAPGSVLLGADATEARLAALSASGELARYRVLSFATHGLLAGEVGATNAALVLTPDGVDDGLLTTPEIATLRLDADLVILSACNTAGGSAEADEGLSGLASAFFVAGARTLLVSQWPVWSDAAERTGVGVAEGIGAGLAPGEALRRTMLEILDDPASTVRELDPGWWGAFVAVGG